MPVQNLFRYKIVPDFGISEGNIYNDFFLIVPPLKLSEDSPSWDLPSSMHDVSYSV